MILASLIYIYHYFILLFLIVNLLFYTLILLFVTIKIISWFSTKQIHWAWKCRGAQVNAPCRLWSHHVSSHLLSHGLITWSWLFRVTRVTGFSLLQNSYLPLNILSLSVCGNGGALVWLSPSIRTRSLGWKQMAPCMLHETCTYDTYIHKLFLIIF